MAVGSSFLLGKSKLTAIFSLATEHKYLRCILSSHIKDIDHETFTYCASSPAHIVIMR